jgi:hypothetical protein
MCLFRAFIQIEYFLVFTQSKATIPVVSYCLYKCECAAELDIFRLDVSEYSNIYHIFMQWIIR